MSNIIDFTKKTEENKHSISDEMLSLSIYMDNDGAYEVYMEVSDMYTDMEIFEAIMAAGSKFAIDHDLVDYDEGPVNDN